MFRIEHCQLFISLPSPYSLPVNVDETELIALLTDHLSHYAEIKNVKIIHDARGGVCAFVQCEVGDALAISLTRIYAKISLERLPGDVHHHTEPLVA